MKKKASAISVLCLLAGIYLGAQLQQPRLSVGGAVLKLDMSKQEALRKLSACCKPFPFGKTAVMVTDKNNVNKLLGVVYFYGEKVDGIAADKDSSPELAAYETGMAFYRLVDGLAHGGPTKVTLYSYSREASNGSSKTVVLMQGARRIRIEMTNTDPSEKNLSPQQVTVSECAGACSDW